MRATPAVLAAAAFGGLLTVAAVVMNEAPVVCLKEAVDTLARFLTVEAPAKGRIRQVVLDDRSIMRSARRGDGSFKGQAASFVDVRPWKTRSIVTRQRGDREVAEAIRAIHASRGSR